MGYSTMLDIVSSMIIGGILMLSLHQVDENATSNLFYYNSDMILQSNLISVVTMLEDDMKRIGYCQNPSQIPVPTQAIIQADTSSFKFVGDVENNGTIDTITYFLSGTSELSSTPNPRDRKLFRQTSTDANRAIGNMGITQFRLDYFDSFGAAVTTPITGARTGLISTIQVSVRVESPDSYLLDYNSAYWRQVRISAKNLANR